MHNELQRIEHKLDHVLTVQRLILEAIEAGNDTARVQQVVAKMRDSEKALNDAIAKQQ
jgi:hypothetical protein